MKKGPYTIFPIDERTTLIEERYFGANCLMYLLQGDDRALLIDTGVGGGDLAGLVSGITDKPVDVVNTHGHFDHIGANWQFCDIYAAQAERDVLAMHQNHEYLSSLARSRLSRMTRLLLAPKLKKLLRPRRGGNYHFIRDGHVFELGGRRLEVLLTPGHSVGSLCLLDVAGGMLFSGDTVCELGVLLNLDGSAPPRTYLDSLTRLQARAGDFERIYAGHHSRPIDKSYLDDYARCALQITQDQYSPSANKNFRGAGCGKISIALPEHSG
jgi:glyoxylase-like metal-dependent hydrolase (beta-lactamase superfamily II)